MALNYVTLTLDLYDTQGNPLDAGLVSFYPSAALVDTTEHQDIPQVSVVVDLSAEAVLPRTVSLLATDNADTLPSGWGWTVSFSGVPGDPASFSFFLAHADGADQYLSDQSPVEDVTTMGAYMPLPSGTATDGYVPVATGSGEASAWGAPAGGISPPAGDIGGTTDSPTVVSTHLTDPLPLAQGGTDNTTGQPSGTATGDLSGSYPDPAVAGIDGTALSGGQPAGNPVAGSVLTSVAADSMSWQPPQNPTRQFRPQKIKIDQAVWMGTSGHPFTFHGTGATGSNADTSTFVLGSESVYVTTNGSGNEGSITGTFGSALNLTGQSLVIWVQLDTYANELAGYPRFYVGDTGLSNCYYWKLGEAAGQPWALDGEWMRITLPFGAAATVGSPNRASLAALTIQVFDNSGGPVTLHLGGIATMLEPAQLFPKGVISITFDDGLISQYNTAAPLMDVYGWGGTANLITETLWNHAGGAFNDYFALTNAQQLEKYHGWEMATHAYTAANHNSTYTGISDAAALADMQAAKNYMQLQGFRSPDLMAFPLGLYNANTLTNVSTMFTAGRSISQLGGFADETVPPADLLRLRSQTFGDANTLTQAENLALAASNNHEWVIYTFHDIVASAVTNLEWSTANFTSLLSYINGLGTPVMLVSDVLRAGAQADIQVVSAIAAGDTSVVIGGTASAPTIETATLDVIATDHPPAGAVAMNSEKITGLANGSASSDAAAFGQIPVLSAADTSVVVGGSSTAPTVRTSTLDVVAADHPAAADWSNNSHKITGLANGTASTDAAAFGQLSAAPAPSDVAMVGWTINPECWWTVTAALTVGAIYLAEFWVREPQTISNIIVHLNTVGNTLTTNECFAAIIDSGGTQRGITADQSAVWASPGTAGVKTMALTSPYANAPAGRYYVAFVANGTTGPIFRAGGSSTGTILNTGLSGANLRFATNGTGTTIGNLTLANNVTTNAQPIAAAVS